MDAKIRYLAINTDQPEVLADFYRTYFGLRALGRSDGGDIALTDGWVNVSLLKRPPEALPGLSHYGLAVQDIRELEARLEEMGAKTGITSESGDACHGDYRIHDPNGYPISVSVHDFGVDGKGPDRMRIRHVSFCALDPDPVLDFVTGAFGLREVSTSLNWRAQNDKKRFAGDGDVNWGCLPAAAYSGPNYVNARARAISESEMQIGWFDHFGFVVPDMAAVMNGFPPDLGGRPAGVHMAEQRVLDPDHNGMDLSQVKGFEVDLNVWKRPND